MMNQLLDELEQKCTSSAAVLTHFYGRKDAKEEKKERSTMRRVEDFLYERQVTHKPKVAAG